MPELAGHFDHASALVNQGRRERAPAVVRRSPQDAPIKDPAETDGGHGGILDAVAPAAQMDEPTVGVGDDQVIPG